MRNFYKVLGIAASADEQRIKTAFRRRAKAVHPDLNPGNRRAEARFIELMQAYEALSDARTRAAYDAYLAEQRAQSRRRLMHCAGLMMTSFMLTATSAIFALSLAGANVPFRETWQLAVAAFSAPGAKSPAAESDGSGWSTKVAVAPGPDASASTPETRTAATARKAEARPVPSKSMGARSRQDADAPVKEPRQQVASKQSAPSAKRVETLPSSVHDETWPFPPPPSDEPRYSLGASDLR